MGDPEPLKPAHLLHGRRITCLPHEMVDIDELTDPTFGSVSMMQRRANAQAAIIRDFQARWHHEYLTSLREHHKASGDNIQPVRNGEVVLVHDDVPRTPWQMATIEDLIIGRDGLTQAATIRTINGMISRPITRLYPLEFIAGVEDQSGQPSPGTKGQPEQPMVQAQATTDPVDSEGGGSHPKQASAKRAAEKFKNWARIFAAPPSQRMSQWLNCN